MAKKIAEFLDNMGFTKKNFRLEAAIESLDRHGKNNWVEYLETNKMEVYQLLD